MKQKDLRTLQERADDLSKVLTFSILSTIKKYYKSIDAFKKEYAAIKNCKSTTDKQVAFCARFKHTYAQYKKVIGKIDGKYVSIDDILQYLPSWLHYQKHFSKNYKTGKSYHVHSYWYIDFDMLEKCFDDDSVYDPNSDFYTKRQHILIDKVIIKHKQQTMKTSHPQTTIIKQPIAKEQEPIAELSSSVDTTAISVENPPPTVQDNSDIDEENTVYPPSRPCDKVIAIALQMNKAHPRAADAIFGAKLVPVEESMRFYKFTDQSGKTKIFDSKSGALRKIDCVKCGGAVYEFSVGTANVPKQFRKSTYQSMLNNQANAIAYRDAFLSTLTNKFQKEQFWKLWQGEKE